MTPSRRAYLGDAAQHSSELVLQLQVCRRLGLLVVVVLVLLLSWNADSTGLSLFLLHTLGDTVDVAQSGRATTTAGDDDDDDDDDETRRAVVLALDDDDDFCCANDPGALEEEEGRKEREDYLHTIVT